MAKVNITEAIELSGVSRATFYNKYLNQNVISVETDENGKKSIDTAELLRVFGALAPNKENSIENSIVDDIKQDNIQAYTREIELLTIQLREYKEREERLLNTIDNFAAAMKLIEHKKEDPPRKWWRFGR